MANEILPYGENTKNHCGSLGALEIRPGIEREAMLNMAHDETITVTAKDGHTWHVRKNLTLYTAYRPETSEEIRAGQEALERRTFSHFFSIDRQRLCTGISGGIRMLSLQLKPDNPPPRAKRRQLRAHIDELGSLLTELLTNPRAEVKAVRERYLKLQSW